MNTELENWLSSFSSNAFTMGKDVLALTISNDIYDNFMISVYK